jgi:chromosome segregation protein
VGAINEMNLQIERLYGNKKNTESAIQRTRESIQSIERGINKRREDIESSKEEMTTFNEIIAAAEDELQELLAKRDTIKREEAAVDEKYVEIRDTIAELEERQEKFRREIDSVGTEIHACEMNQREIEINTKNLLEKIREKYNKPLELKEFDDLESYDFKSSRQEVADLEQKLKNIGPVNSIAYEEYEEEKQRLDFLLKQRNDLIQSEKDLLKTIDEINTKAKILFTETFELIRANFINIFQRLFNPGDEADLRLEENVDPLEAGINIIAKPRGKRPTSIELLSGGEKTLTAIALLFAIYLVKPSPFCILDEIDAPLDDANIDRFSKILRDFSKNTQFITVTHNKRTMEMADILYGVTMQEEGISKLVSVKFNEDFNIVA